MSSITTTDLHSPAEGQKVTGFVILTILSLAVCAVSLYLGRAPFTSTYLTDWFDWLRTEPTWPVVFGVSILVLLVGLSGIIARLISGATAQVSRPRREKSAPSSPFDTAVSVPAEPVNTRASLKFDAETMAASGLTIPATAVETVADLPRPAEPPMVELRSLEPAIFSDNASDSFLTRKPEVVAVEAPPVETLAVETKPSFNAEAALEETHGLKVASAQVIPIRPDIRVETADLADAVEVIEAPVAAPLPVQDPVEAALLAETPEVETRSAPASDINAVMSSTRRFLDGDEAASVAEPAAETPAPLNGFHAVAAAMEPSDDQAVIRQAVQMALSVWPDATRAIASDELNVRAAYLYYDKAPQSARAFQQIASGDLSAAATTLQNHADTLASDGTHAQAAEIWRVIGALHMGRDDPKALHAYEKVSELDPTDANIHLYLARRYQMANESGKQLPVLTRALAVIGDPSTRLELLAPYADLKMKSGDLQAAGDAFEELGRLHETRAYLKPDDVQARSAQGISLARGAQAREMQGSFDLAGPLYKKAHSVFADLSTQMPEHAGLRSMAENALRDAQRFQTA